jgi:hypothetical protein
MGVILRSYIPSTGRTTPSRLMGGPTDLALVDVLCLEDLEYG